MLLLVASWDSWDGSGKCIMVNVWMRYEVSETQRSGLTVAEREAFGRTMEGEIMYVQSTIGLFVSSRPLTSLHIYFVISLIPFAPKQRRIYI